MASDRVQGNTPQSSVVDYKAELIQFPQDRIVRTRVMQRKLQDRVRAYMQFDVSSFEAFTLAREKLEIPRNFVEGLA